MLLLSAAGLANLTFIERQVFPHMTARGTAQSLVSAADRFPDNVFILDQVRRHRVLLPGNVSTVD